MAESKPKKRRSRNSLSRAEILQAALSIIQESGIESLSMRTIARKLNCSVASPYAYFQNRDDIIKELISNGEEILTRDLKKAQKSSQDVFEQLTAIAHTYWNFAVANRELHKLMFNTLGPSTGKVFRYYPKSYKLFLETLKHGTQTGKIKFSKAGYHAIARTMWAWIYGLLVLELTGLLQRRNKNSDPVEEGVYFFLKLLKQGEA